MSDGANTEVDEVMVLITAAIERGRAGDRAGARDELEQLWGETDDALHLATIAHFVADLQESVADELRWDERALAAVTDLTDERARRYNDSFRVRAFLPSLHLSLADAHRRSGHTAEAHQHVAAAEAELDALPYDDYGVLIHTSLEKIKRALDDRSTAPLIP